MSDDKMQTEFEAWAETKNLPIGRYHYGNTWGYADDRTNRAFEAYQAGRKAEREAMQREREEWSKAVNKAWIITASEREGEL